MSRGASETLLASVNSEFTNEAFIHLVTVFWDDNTEDRFAKNYEIVTSRGSEYGPSSFTINIPEEVSDDVPTLRMEFGLNESTIINKLNNSTNPPLVRFEIVLGSDPDVVELGPFDFDVREYQTQGASVTVEMGFEPILDLAVPQLTFTPAAFPGLFKDVSAGDFD